MGIIALLLSCMPFVGVVSLPLSGLGLAMGVGGCIFCILRHGPGFGMSIAGSCVSVVALLFGIIWLTLVATISSTPSRTGPSVQQTPNADTTPANGEEPSHPVAAGPQTPAQPDWADASRVGLQSGDVNIRLGPVVVNNVTLKTFEAGKSEDKLLQITVTVKNASATRKIDYESWGDTSQLFDKHIPSLSDNFGNSYKRVTFGFATKVVGQQRQASIHPGQSITDLVVFEAPLANVQYLQLDLPTSAFAGAGKDLKFRIPASMIQRP
jgi:hypothetical protein